MRTFLLAPVLMTAAVSATVSASPPAYADSEQVVSVVAVAPAVERSTPSPTATADTMAGSSAEDDPAFRPDELQGTRPYLAIGALLLSGVVAVAVAAGWRSRR